MGSPIRVLHVVVNMNRGGAETLIMNLYRNIDRSKVQFDFLTSKAGVFDEEILAMGGKIYRIPYVTEGGPIAYRRRLRDFFESHSFYPIVHSHLDKMSGFVLKEAKRKNIKIRIAHSHNTKSEGAIAIKLFKWFIGRTILSQATHYYACSHDAANWLFKDQAYQSYILKNGIELDKYKYRKNVRTAMRKELKIAEDTFLIGHIGRFNQQKNHLYLLELFAEINQELKNCQLVLVGDGQLRSKIEAKVRQLNLDDKVMLLGVRGDTQRLYQAFDLFLFPSLHEGLPVTLVEAQTAGLPCLISDNITEEIDLGRGLITQSSLQDKEEWVQQVKKISMSNRSRILGDDGFLKNYEIKNIVKETENNYLALGGA